MNSSIASISSGGAGVGPVVDHGDQVLHLTPPGCGSGPYCSMRSRSRVLRAAGRAGRSAPGCPSGTCAIPPGRGRSPCPSSGNSRVPAPTITGQTISVISSTSSRSSSQRISWPLPCTCSSPPGRAFSSRMAASRSPESTVVSAHSGSVIVFDATNFGRVFRAPDERIVDVVPHPPVPGEELVGAPAEQERVGALVEVADVARSTPRRPAAAPSRLGRIRGRAPGCSRRSPASRRRR